MLHITNQSPDNTWAMYRWQEELTFQTYLGLAIAKKTADPKLAPDFSSQLMSFYD